MRGILRPHCYRAWVSQKHGGSGAPSTVSRSCRSMACGPFITHVDIAEDTDVWGLLAVEGQWHVVGHVVGLLGRDPAYPEMERVWM